MFITIHLYEDGTKPSGHFHSCILLSNKRTWKRVKLRGVPQLPSLLPEQELSHAISFYFYPNKNIWLPIYSLNEGKAALRMLKMFLECILIWILGSRIVFVSPGNLKQFFFLQVHNRKQSGARPLSRRLLLRWTTHTGHSSFSILMNKQILLQLV